MESKQMIAFFPDPKMLSVLMTAETLGIGYSELNDYIVEAFIKKLTKETTAAEKTGEEVTKKKADHTTTPAPQPDPAKALSTKSGPLKEVATVRKTETLGTLLKKQKGIVSPEKFRSALVQKGILEERWRDGEPSRYRCLTEKGLKYGKNLRKEGGYAVRFYVDTFQELFDIVKDAL